jgi:hypothetical protein
MFHVIKRGIIFHVSTMEFVDAGKIYMFDDSHLDPPPHPLV